MKLFYILKEFLLNWHIVLTVIVITLLCKSIIGFIIGFLLIQLFITILNIMDMDFKYIPPSFILSLYLYVISLRESKIRFFILNNRIFIYDIKHSEILYKHKNYCYKTNISNPTNNDMCVIYNDILRLRKENKSEKSRIEKITLTFNND